MRISVKPDPEDRYMLINVDGDIVAVENLNQDIEFDILSDEGQRLESGKTADSFAKALGRHRVHFKPSHSDELIEYVVDRTVAGSAFPFAARSGEDSIEVAEIDIDRIYSVEELDWTYVPQIRLDTVPLKR